MKKMTKKFCPQNKVIGAFVRRREIYYSSHPPAETIVRAEVRLIEMVFERQ